ncbi:MAG: PEP-CTERM sorting domain-containing protein [Roseateles sp.]|uniref:PEP-CTERM sorting domain-containing protein n=1 Tax=Roseateles sp. TaxID=1971397 RepID=UPI004036C56D
MKKILLALSLAALLPAAQAITFEGAVTQGATVVDDYSALGLVSFDIDLANTAPVTISWRIDDEDLLGPIDFNAVIRNYTGAGLQGLTLTLDRSGFAGVGSVTRQFGGSTVVGGSGATRTLMFTPVEFLDLELGNALGGAGKQDWTLSQAGFQVGDRFSLTVTAVPEPGQYALLLAGLAGLALLARGRRST